MYQQNSKSRSSPSLSKPSIFNLGRQSVDGRPTHLFKLWKRPSLRMFFGSKSEGTVQEAEQPKLAPIPEIKPPSLGKRLSFEPKDDVTLMNPPQTSPVPEEFKSMLHTYWSSDPIPVDSSPETSPESTAPVDIKPISNSPTKSGFSPPKEITEDWIVQQLSSPVDVVTHFEDLRKYVMNPSHEEEILPAEPLVRRKSSSRPKSFTESHVLFKVDVNTGPQEEEIPVVEEEIAVLHRQTHVRRKVNKSPEEERDEPPQEPPPEPEYKKKKKWGWLKRLFEPKRSYDDDWNPYPKDDLPVGPSRLTLEQEKVVYALSHIKLAQTGRPLEHQVMISNLMMYILSVHSDVTIRGRGPRARAKRTRMRKQPVQIVKQESESDSESSSEDEQEDNVPLGMLNIRSVGLQTAETTA